METGPLGTDVVDAARWLRKRKENGHRTVLLLGARAGGLFRSKFFYSTSKLFSLRSFNTMTRTQQFGECYRVLSEGDFTRSDIHSILRPSLQSLKAVQADSYLASFVQSSIFDVIISTNVDNLLSKALEEVGMEAGEDFQVFIPQKHSSDEIVHQHDKHHSCTLIKISGDLESGDYTLFKQNFYLETHDMLRTFLSSTLSRATLMLGYDPIWDRALDVILPARGQELWYVNEEKPGDSLAKIVQDRGGKRIVGGEGGYEAFMQNLYWHLDEEKSLQESLLLGSWKNELHAPGQFSETQTTAAPSSNPQTQMQTAEEVRSEKEQRTNVFIGYSHKDLWYLKKLKGHMAHYEREKLLNVWDDQKVKPGMNYLEELQSALDTTKIAILLVSADFIASDLIANTVFPSLLQSAEKRGAVILPVLLKPCVFEDTVIQQFQPFDDKPLSAKKPHEKDQLWVDLVRVVITLGKDIEHDKRSI